MTPKQIETKCKIETIAQMFGVDADWAVAIAMTESSLGMNQKSPTGCLGVFQMSQIAMKDIWLTMAEVDDDFADIACGVLFLRLLLKRWKTMEEATKHFCDPMDAHFYVDRVMKERGRLRNV